LNAHTHTPTFSLSFPPFTVHSHFLLVPARMCRPEGERAKWLKGSGSLLVYVACARTACRFYKNALATGLRRKATRHTILRDPVGENQGSSAALWLSRSHMILTVGFLEKDYSSVTVYAIHNIMIVQKPPTLNQKILTDRCYSGGNSQVCQVRPHSHPRDTHHQFFLELYSQI